MATFEGRSTKLQYVSSAFITDPTYPASKVNGESPYNEKIMSMPSVLQGKQSSFAQYEESMPVDFYFFIYNLENYYHFLYDTLPYLVQYHTLKLKFPAMKLLISPTHQWLPFQIETLHLLGIEKKDCIPVQEGVLYTNLVIPPSLTHGGYSNEPPSSLARSLWSDIGKKVLDNNVPLGALSKGTLQSCRKCELQDTLISAPAPPALTLGCSCNSHLTVGSSEYPKKIYISRRSWIHGDMSNIGTNYTTRRRCINEDAVVEYLKHKGYVEVFCETLSMEEKIQLFAGATHVIGCIGGGMANLLFSPKETKSFVIETPDFLRINARFVHSMNHTNIQYLPISQHAPFEGPFPLFTRVSVKDTNCIGEIEEFINGYYKVKISQNNIAGFAFGADLPSKLYAPTDLTPLDQGLNSPFCIDIDSLARVLV